MQGLTKVVVSTWNTELFWYYYLFTTVSTLMLSGL